MVESDRWEPELDCLVEQGGLPCELPYGLPSGPPWARAEAERVELVPAGWRGRVSELKSDALAGFWAEAVAYARWEIAQYARWRGQDEPVLASGYDAEGVVQGAFERLLGREATGAAIFYSREDIEHELRSLIKHRVRWLHERRETRLVLSEWDVLPPRADGERVSIFDYLPGGLEAPDEELMRKEKEQWQGRLKAGIERKLRKRKDLVEVFRRMWDGQKRREIARGMGAGVARVKALRAQLRRRLGWLRRRGSGKAYANGGAKP